MMLSGDVVNAHGMVVVGTNLSEATHGIITTKVHQSYSVLHELAACLANPGSWTGDKLFINFHPRAENFGFNEYKGAVVIGANVGRG